MVANISSAFCTGSYHHEDFPLHAQCELQKKQVTKLTKDADKQGGIGVAQPSGALPALVRKFACFPPFR
jgi:hypothetical protein